MKTTFKYRIEIRANVSMTAFGRNRKMTDAQLEAFRQKMNQSFLKGGVNQARGNDTVPHISRMVMKPNAYFDRDQVIAVARAPMFEVVA